MSGTVAAAQPIGQRRTAALTLAALGVVFGDIGTSPLYTVKECFSEFTGLQPTPENVLGILSLITWAADRRRHPEIRRRRHARRQSRRGRRARPDGPGVAPAGDHPRRRRIYLMLGMLGAALFYGDCLLTPAISVLSAVEGLKVATPALQPVVAADLHRRAGGAVRRAALRHGGRRRLVRADHAGLVHRPVRARPEADRRGAAGAVGASCRHHAIAFALHHGCVTLFALGAVTFAVTGAEALYADMGHFRPRADPSRLAVAGAAGAAANYYGQGALLLADPGAIDNPFFRLAPAWALYPLVALATVATVIASQATISGAFSMAQQAALLGLQRAHPRRAHVGAASSARSTCRRSTGCCWWSSSGW